MMKELIRKVAHYVGQLVRLEVLEEVRKELDENPVEPIVPDDEDSIEERIKEVGLD